MPKLQHKGTQVLTSERLILRPFKKEDAEEMFRSWASREPVTRFLRWPAHRDIETTNAILDLWTCSYQESDFYQWAICIKEHPDKPIGSISVNNKIVDPVRKACIGYVISNDYWHQSITSETLKTVINFLFDEVHVLRIEAKHDVLNPHAGEVMKKCGMKFEGTLRQADYNNLGVCNIHLYSMLPTDKRR